MCKFSYLRNWLTREGYSPDCMPRSVILECIPSRSGMSMSVYDRELCIMRINGYGYDRIGTALGNFLEALFQEELWAAEVVAKGLYGAGYRGGPARDGFSPSRISLNGACGFDSMAAIADAIGLQAQLHECKTSTLIIVSKKGA